MQTTKRIMATALALFLTLGVFAISPMTAMAANNVPYLDENGDQKTKDNVEEIILGSLGTFPDLNDLNGGWYLVSGTQTFTNAQVTVTGNVHLILADGCDLNITGAANNAGITVTGTDSLTVYAQSADPSTMGKLTATGGSSGAGIGGSSSVGGGTVTINGGNLAAGIGGGGNGAGGTVTINGGDITAQGGNNGAGIGGGGSSGGGSSGGGSGGNITINSGDITATGSGHGVGIGGGGSIIGGGGGAGGNILIYGESTTVAAKGANDIGAGGGTATVGGAASTVVYDTSAVTIAVTKNTATDTVGWSASPNVGTFASTSADSTTYAPPAAPTGDITLTATLTAAGTVATPAANPAGGSYAAAQSVTLTCATPNATIYYTLDGSDPTANLARLTYSGAINVPMGTTLKAYATAADMIDSAVMTAVYTQQQNNNNVGGNSYTPPNTLRVVGSPRVTPLSGTSARLGIQATGGNTPYTYQWQYIGSWIDIPGATSAEFTWEGLTPGQTYTVCCVVKDRSGTTVISPELTFIAGEGLSAFPVKGEITAKNVNVRPEPNTKGKRLGRLQTGDSVSILGYTAPKGYTHGFYKIAWSNAQGFAYISADYVSVTFTSPLNAAITGRVYLQSRMNTAKKYRLATLTNGNTAKLLGRYKTWWLVEYNGEKAFLKNGKYMQP